MTVRANIISSKVKTSSVNGTGNYPSGLGSDDEGLTIFDSQLGALVFWTGTKWNQVRFKGSGGLTANSAITDFATWIATSPSSGNYWVRPNGYGGTAEQVYIAVNDSSQSSITSGGVWVRVRYLQSYYSRSNPWSGTGLSNPASQSTTAYSGDFAYEQSNGWIGALLSPGNYEEIRQIFESWGYGSVGWTYGSGYMESRGFDDVNYTRWNGGANIIGKDYTRVTGMSHSVIGSAQTDETAMNNFFNPTLSGADRTDANDSTWRYGRMTFRFVPSNNTDSRLPLPVKGVWNADVDGGTEQRYFPFRDAAGGRSTSSTTSADSNIWVKVG